MSARASTTSALCWASELDQSVVSFLLDAAVALGASWAPLGSEAPVPAFHVKMNSRELGSLPPAAEGL